jgi:hypothetical protein
VCGRSAPDHGVDVADGPARSGSTRSAAAALGWCEEGERGEGDADQVGRLRGLS